jgi:hypothetical protein
MLFIAAIDQYVGISFLSKNTLRSWWWWPMLVILARKRLGQEDCELEATLGCLMSSRLHSKKLSPKQKAETINVIKKYQCGLEDWLKW